jgi:hypothetical protein
MNMPIQLGPWPLGINDRQEDYALPDGTLRAAVNVDLDNLGFAHRRLGYAKASSALYFDAANSSVRFSFQFKARQYTVEESTPTVLLFSDEFDTTTARPAYNRITFGHAINVCVPVDNGIWVATEQETHFLAGKDPTVFDLSHPLPHGGLFDSGKLLPSGFAIWTSTHGVMVGDPGGQVKNLTYANMKPLVGTSVSALVVQRNGMIQYLAGIR